MKKHIVLTSLFLFSISIVLAQVQRKKIAICIGNDEYFCGVDKLTTCIKEAENISEKLSEYGFDTIIIRDGTRTEMLKAIDDFFEKIKAFNSDDIVFFYYSGHGSSYKGLNYLVPVDACLKEANNIPEKCVSIDNVRTKMSMLNTHLNMLVFDACRNGERISSKRLETTGENHEIFAQDLPPIQNNENELPTSNMIESYATHEGFTARESIYTPALIHQMKTQNVKVQDIFLKTMEEIQKKNPAYKPIMTITYTGNFCFRETCGNGLNNNTTIGNRFFLDVEEDIFGVNSRTFQLNLGGNLINSGYKMQNDEANTDLVIVVRATTNKISDRTTPNNNTAYSVKASVDIIITDKNGDVQFARNFEKTVISTISYESSAENAYKELAEIVADEIELHIKKQLR